MGEEQLVRAGRVNICSCARRACLCAEPSDTDNSDHFCVPWPDVVSRVWVLSVLHELLSSLYITCTVLGWWEAPLSLL